MRVSILDPYRWGALLLALAGCVAAVRQRRRDSWTLIVAALGTIVLAFLARGAFTPIEMRASLAAQPIVASLAALGAWWLWNKTRLVYRAAAVAGVSATVWAGISALRDVLG